jgi:hypothetical protein
MHTSISRAFRLLHGFALLGCLLVVLAAWAPSAEQCEPAASTAPARAEYVVPLRRAEARLRDCQARGSCTEGDLTWYGMTRVSGYVIDSANQDILLYGSREEGAPRLYVEDFIVAIKNVLHHYVVPVPGKKNTFLYSDPAVSIDPDGNVLRRLDDIFAEAVRRGGATLDQALETWCTVCTTSQRVRGEGIPFDSHFMFVMFTADELLKHIGNGSAPIEGLDSHAALVLRQAIAADLGEPGQDPPAVGLNRYWFTAGSTRFREDARAVLLDEANVVLRTEAEAVTAGGRIGASGNVDPLAETFACSMSLAFPRLAGTPSPFPTFSELESMFRWVAIAHLMVEGTAFDDAAYRPTFLVDGFTIRKFTVPATIPGVPAVQRWDHDIPSVSGQLPPT